MFKTMSGETKIFLGIILVTIVILVGAIFFFSAQDQKNQIGYTRQELTREGNFAFGNASSSAYLVEFSDYECPACGTFEPTVKKIREDFQDKLQVVYRNFPLAQHPYAEKAAIAAEAAGKMGKFWEMHDELFVNQSKLSDQTVNEIVKKLNLNEEEFAKLIKDQSVKDIVLKDRADGSRVGVNSTPTFYLNGKEVKPRSPQDLYDKVQESLK